MERLHEQGGFDVPHEDRYRKGSLSLLAIPNQARFDWRPTALCEVPRRSWLWMRRVAHIRPCLVMYADGVESDKCSMEDDGDEWMEYANDEHDPFAEEHEDREDGNDDVEVCSAGSCYSTCPKKRDV